MLIAAHSLAGGMIGDQLGNPFWAFFVGVISHFILDTIPHYDTTDGGKMTLRQILFVCIDGLLGLSILFFIIKPDLNFESSFLWGAVGGIFPDFLDNVPFWKKCFQKTGFGKNFHKFHADIQFKKTGPFYGIFVQVIVIVFSMYFSF